MPVALVIPLAIMMLARAGPVAAHGTAPVPPDALPAAWSFDPLVLVPLLALHWLYGRGVFRLWRHAGRQHGLTRRHVAAFVSGELMLVAALVSPLDALGGTLLSAHMAQHALLMVVAPPLLLLGKPWPALAWALPRRWPLQFARTARIWVAPCARPAAATTLQALAMWIWHAPALFMAALENAPVHTLEHATFFITGLLFWHVVLTARAPASICAAIVAAFFTLMHSGLLGGLITMAPTPLYPVYGGRAELWGLDELSDQQLAGLIMWVPMGLAYLGAALWLSARLIRSAPQSEHAPRPRVEPSQRPASPEPRSPCRDIPAPPLPH